MSQDALHPLVRRLITERAYPYLDNAEDAAGLDGRDLFVLLPAHGKVHLESPDIAVVLPELVQALGVRNASAAQLRVRALKPASARR